MERARIESEKAMERVTDTVTPLRFPQTETGREEKEWERGREEEEERRREWRRRERREG